MWCLHRVSLAATAWFCVLVSTAALAQKPVVPEDFRWAGFYAGAYAGQAWAESEIRTDAGNASLALPFTYFAPTDIVAINQLASGSVGAQVFVGGVQVGTSLQAGKFVFGLEADYGSFNLNGTRGGNYVIPNPDDPNDSALGTVRATMSTDWLLTARGRIGWTPTTNLLIYATGGLAVTELRVSNSYSDNAPSAGVGGSSTNKMMFGWTLGGGAEWALTRDWSLKAEYMRVNFGAVSTQASVFCGPLSQFDCTPFAIPSPLNTTVDLSADVARVGLNYKFD
jgi:outer membrane immunogenic protein